jgi:predicted DCC family thiol-disulfide oxidoreductase YuxK
MTAATCDWQIKMLFDGQCPLCSREVALLRRRNAKGRVAFEDIADPSFDPAKYGLTMAQVIGAIKAVRPDGSILTGLDVFVEVYEAVGWTWLARPLRWRLTRPLAQLGYRAFAAIRPKFSGLKAHDCAGGTCRPGTNNKGD